jgi:hypothetical protein
MADKGYLIGEDFSRKLRETVSRVIGEPVGSGGYRLETDLSGDPPTIREFRIATFTGAWSISEVKQVTLYGVTSTPNTVSVTNLVCGMSPASACDVSIARAGTAWYVVQPNLTQLPGYSASGTQVLTIVSGNLRWLGTTACA